MKKIAAISIITALLIASLSACGKKAEQETTTEEVTTTEAVTTTTVAETEVYGECETVENEDGSITPKEVYKAGLAAKAANLDGDPLNVRTGPGSDYVIVGSFDEGAEFEIEAQYDGWGYVSTDDFKGWVSLDYVEMSGSTASNVTAATTEPAGDVTADEAADAETEAPEA